MKYKAHLPVIGVVLSLILFIAAASQYPGYDWSQNFMSSLFAATTSSGAPNPARLIAIAALALLCTALGYVFARIATTAKSPAHRKIIQIGGIGAMVYAFLIATPMHDLMITVALPFALAAMLATAHLVYTERRWLLLGWGALALAVLMANAAMYYANAGVDVLPVLQKVNWAISVSWLLGVDYARSLHHAPEAPAVRSSPNFFSVARQKKPF